MTKTDKSENIPVGGTSRDWDQRPHQRPHIRQQHPTKGKNAPDGMALPEDPEEFRRFFLESPREGQGQQKRRQHPQDGKIRQDDQGSPGQQGARKDTRQVRQRTKAHT